MFQHLRRCCRTQLLNEGHPTHLVSRWMGHGEKVGDEHYTMMTDDMLAAVTKLGTLDSPIQRGAKSGAEKSRKPLQMAANEKLTDSKVQNKKGVSPGKTREITPFCGVVRAGNDPATHGFSVPSSKNGKSSKNLGKTGRFDDLDSTQNSPCQQKAGCFASATINPKQSLISSILHQLEELELSQLKTVHDMIALIHADVLKTKVS